jgi:hypothetical protein
VADVIGLADLIGVADLIGDLYGYEIGEPYAMSHRDTI